MLTQERLKELISYNPDTGEFRWLVDRGPKTPAGSVTGARGTGKGRYGQIGIDRRVYRAHRVAWLYMTGSWPREIDHLDQDPFNNKWSNLREASRTQNNANRSACRKNALGVKGVYKAQHGSASYLASINFGGKRHYLGSFKTIEEASAAYQVAAKLQFGEFAA